MSKILDILRGRFPEREYIIMEEVRDDAGFNANRSADFVAVNTWPSRGLSIHGMEMKSSRTDWLRELKDPSKAESIFKFCDYFWLLTTTDGVANINEIPDVWGWLSIKGTKVVCLKDAPKLEATKDPTKGFFIAMLKRAADKTNYVHRDSIKDELQSVKEQAEGIKSYRLEKLTEEVAELRKRIHDFETASGIRLDRYSNNIKIGEAVRFLSNGGVSGLEADLKRLGDKSTEINNHILRLLESIK